MSAAEARGLAERFGAPDAWHAPGTYWFWHRLPSETEIRTQVSQMHAAGFRSFQIQARMAYPIDGYLNDDYLAACRIAVEEAAELGMIVGVYDDYNWQTGHAGGRAVDGHDELRERHLFWASGVVVDGMLEVAIDGIHSSTESLGAPGMAWHYEGSESAWVDWEIAFAIEGEGESARDATQEARVIESGPQGCRVEVESGEGTPVTVFISARSATSRLINPLDPAAVQRFIDAGYEPFRQAFGDHFGTTVKYFFYDQPHANFYSWAQHRGDLGSAMPFERGLVDAIKRQWSGEHPRVLLSLLTATTAEEKAMRSSFYDFFSSRAIDTFLGALHRWASRHGVALSGHEVLAHVGQWDLTGAFDGWDLRVDFGLDYFGVDSCRDLTAVDAQDLVPQLSAKMGDSVARSHGRSGTMLEQYFGNAPTGSGEYAGHWGLTLEQLRAQTIRHHLLGMRQLIFHGFYQTDGWDDDPTMFSNPRFDFPPGINFEPWFTGHHADFAIESGRLSEFIEGTLPSCDVAVLYPLRTVWVEGQNGEQAREAGTWARVLAEEGYGYHFIDERDLLGAVVDGGRISFGERRYSALVLPAVTTLLGAETMQVIDAAARAGVSVISSGSTPHIYQRGAQTAADDWAAACSTGGVRTLARAPESPELSVLLSRTSPGPHFTVDGAVRPWFWAGTVEGAERVVVFNDSTEPCQITVSFSSDAEILRWDTLSGMAARCGSGSSLEMTIQPMELVLLSSGDSGPVEEPSVAPRWGLGAELAGPWLLSIPEGEHAYAGTDIRIDPAKGWESQGLPDFGGIAVYSTSVDLDGERAIRIELPEVAGSVALSVGGVDCGRRSWAPYAFSVPAEVLRAGANLIEITVAGHAANRYYAGTGMRDAPEPVGMLATPRIRYEQSERNA